MKFRAPLLAAGKTATGIEVPADVIAELGAGKRPALRVTLGSYTYRTTVGVMDGRFMISVSAEVRANAAVAAGDELDVEIELDTEPRELEVPADLAAALAAEPDALRYFESLSYSNKRRHVLAIDAAKAAETRQRRIEKSVALFKEGRN